MTELAFAKTEYTLSENYNRHLLRHIWRALRDEQSAEAAEVNA